MVTVNIRELKQRASELLRLVREEGRTIRITDWGKVVAHLIPVEQEAAACARLDRLAAEIGARWPNGVSAAEAVAEGRE